jgi:hypothetical protein
MSVLSEPERNAILTRVNPSGDVLEDLRTGAGSAPEPRRSYEETLDRLFAGLRDACDDPQYWLHQQLAD